MVPLGGQELVPDLVLRQQLGELPGVRDQAIVRAAGDPEKVQPLVRRLRISERPGDGRLRLKDRGAEPTDPAK